VSTSSAPPVAPARRPLTAGIGIPAVRDIHAPGWIARRPVWLQAGVVLVVLLAVSGVLRSRELGGDLWFNEGIAAGIATQSFGGVLHAARVGGSAPLYYLLLHLWANGFGTGESSLRSLSLVCALLTIPAGGWAGWTLGGRRAALYGASLFAFSAVLTQFAEQAQPYALLVLLCLIATTAYLQAFVHRRRGHLWLFVIALEAALYTQLSAVFLLFGLVFGTLAVVRCAPAERRPGIVRDALLCLTAIVVLFIPWLPATIDQIAHATSPWHYAPLVGADVPGDLVGGERVDATMTVVVVMALVPLLFVRSRRREPEAVVFWALIATLVTGFGLAGISQVAAPVWVARYFMPLVPGLLLIAALGSARTRIVGFVAVILCIAFCADPAAFASAHMSDMGQVESQLGPRLHPGDTVAVAQPEQTPLASYYLPAGLRYVTPLGPVGDPGYMNWDGALGRLQDSAPQATIVPVIASLRPGQQLLFIRPLTEGVRNWKSSWAALVRLRAAQWGQVLTDDVARGILVPEGTAPDTYPGDCCVADSAVLYRKAS
jgi:mannosyltransferase